MALTQSQPSDWNVLVLCSGPGGEGSLLANLGFKEVIISDFSERALEISRRLDSRLKTLVIDAENISLPDDSYDLVFVQDGLHHLPRPTLGLTEMIRVAKHAVIVIEPHEGLVAKMLGTFWEITGSSELNFVFRWNKWLFSQLIYSSLLLGENTRRLVSEANPDPINTYRFNLRNADAASYKIKVLRLWDHHVTMRRLARLFGGGKAALIVVQVVYYTVELLLPQLGNMFIGLLVKRDMSLRPGAAK